MDDLGNQFELENLDKFLFENHGCKLEEIVEEFEKSRTKEQIMDNSEVQTFPKLQNWSPSNHDEWGNGVPVNLKLLTPHDMEHFLRFNQACREDIDDHLPNEVVSRFNQVEDNFENENLNESCLFVSKDGDKVFTCSFPEFVSPRSSVLLSNSQNVPNINNSQPPSYYDISPYLNNSNNIDNPTQDLKCHQGALSSEIMRGSFMPRYTDPSRHYPSGTPLVDEDVQPKDLLYLNPPAHFHHQDQLYNSNVPAHQGQPIPYSDIMTNESRKRTRSPSPSRPSKQQQQHISNNNNNQSLNEFMNSLMHNKSHDMPQKAAIINKSSTLSPATMSSDTTGASFGESSSPEKSSISSPEQTEEMDQRSSVEWFPFKSKSWCKLFDADRNEVVITNIQLNVDKGFNFSHLDDSFVCQRKNHFQVTMALTFSHQPRFFELEGSLLPINSIYLYFYGVKAESESHIVIIEQSESDRSKHLYQPVMINLNEIRPNFPVKTVVGRLHFGETTLNNMRKRGKPNPDQRFFRLVVTIGTEANEINASEPCFSIVSYASEKIIVRASNPNQFENDPESLWIKGKSGDSICHYGNVGINTKSPTEALTVHGSVKITGQLLEPSDVRIKTDIKEMNTEEQLKNILQINMYQYRYLPSYEEYAGLKNSSHKLVDGSNPTDVPKVGILAQQVNQILPDAVQVIGDVVLPDGNVLEGFLVVNKDRIFMEGIGAVKELSKVTNKLEQRINEIENNNKQLAKFNHKIAKSVFSAGSKSKRKEEIVLEPKFLNEKLEMSSKQEQENFYTFNFYGQDVKVVSWKDKMIKFSMKRWKTMAIAIAISVALICSIIGMAFGIKSNSSKTYPFINTTTTKFYMTTTQSPKLCAYFLSCPPQSGCLSSSCVFGMTGDQSFRATDNQGMTCKVETPISENVNFTETENISSTISDLPTTTIVTLGSDSQNETSSDQQIFEETTTSLDYLQNITSDSKVEVKRQNIDKREDPAGNQSQTLINRESPNIQISFPDLGVTLCKENKMAEAFSIELANDFPLNVNILVEISFDIRKTTAMCSWSWRNWFGRNQTESPCIKEISSSSLKWELPVGYYEFTTYGFLLYDKTTNETCANLKFPSQSSRFTISFSRRCT